MRSAEQPPAALDPDAAGRSAPGCTSGGSRSARRRAKNREQVSPAQRRTATARIGQRRGGRPRDRLAGRAAAAPARSAAATRPRPGSAGGCPGTRASRSLMAAIDRAGGCEPACSASASSVRSVAEARAPRRRDGRDPPGRALRRRDQRAVGGGVGQEIGRDGRATARGVDEVQPDGVAEQGELSTAPSSLARPRPRRRSARRAWPCRARCRPRPARC